jgi:flagellar hook-basal body complex protein FliE
MKELIIGQLNPNLQTPEIRKPAGSPRDAGGATFGDVLKDAIATADNLQKQSNLEIQKLMAGESQDLHATLIAVQKADLSFQLMMQVRNKIVQAYQEIMRMPV